jgi:chaperonin cofactor prefoldin
MAFISDNLQILATLGSALAVYIFIRMGAKRDVQNVEKRLDKVENSLDSINKTLHSLDMRLTKLEGRFEERGYWESREWHKTGTEDKK